MSNRIFIFDTDQAQIHRVTVDWFTWHRQVPMWEPPPASPLNKTRHDQFWYFVLPIFWEKFWVFFVVNTKWNCSKTKFPGTSKTSSKKKKIVALAYFYLPNRMSTPLFCDSKMRKICWQWWKGQFPLKNNLLRLILNYFM